MNTSGRRRLCARILGRPKTSHISAKLQGSRSSRAASSCKGTPQICPRTPWQQNAASSSPVRPNIVSGGTKAGATSASNKLRVGWGHSRRGGSTAERLLHDRRLCALIQHRGSDSVLRLDPANDSQTHPGISSASCRAPLNPSARPRHHPITRSSTHDASEVCCVVVNSPTGRATLALGTPGCPQIVRSTPQFSGPAAPEGYH